MALKNAKGIQLLRNSYFMCRIVTNRFLMNSKK